MSSARRYLTSALLLVVLVAAVLVAVRPALKADRPGIVALLCLVAALVIGGRALWARPGWRQLPVLLAAVAMLPFAVVARGFGRVDMMAILFHTDFGMEGATLKGLESDILAGVISLTLVCLAVYLLGNLWQLGRTTFGGIALALLAVNPLTQFGASQLLLPQVVSDLPGRLASPVLQTPAALPDIVLVYLEGTDRRFADTSVFGDAYGPIAELYPESLSFTNIGQIAGTGWSLAGMVASQCGVPVVPRGLIHRNNFDAIDSFLPAQTCLGDVLARNGYVTEYVVGGDLGFGGIDAFYRTHQITTQFGLEEQRSLYPAEEIEAATIDWILDDQMVFETARTRHAGLIAQPKPFAMIVETIGPHGKLGYLSRRCSASGRGEKLRDTKGVVRCTTEDARDFIREVQARQARTRPDRPLRIIVMSDHLSHNGSTPPVAPELTGVNTVLFLGGPDAGQVNDRPGSMIDVFPSMLDWLGLAKPPVAAGLGRSLLSGPTTLVEDRGIASIDAMLAGDATLGQILWR